MKAPKICDCLCNHLLAVREELRECSECWRRVCNGCWCENETILEGDGEGCHMHWVYSPTDDPSPQEPTVGDRQIDAGETRHSSDSFSPLDWDFNRAEANTFGIVHLQGEGERHGSEGRHSGRQVLAKFLRSDAGARALGQAGYRFGRRKRGKEDEDDQQDDEEPPATQSRSEAEETEGSQDLCVLV